MKKILLSVLCVSLLCFYSDAHAQGENVPGASETMSEPDVIQSIEIQGNQSISSATVLSKIKSRVGDKYLQSVVSDDLKRLYNTGYFSDVRVDREKTEGGVDVIIYLEEKPIVDEITFTKTKYIKPVTLKQKITTQSGKFLDRKTLKKDQLLIKDLYAKKGLTSAKIETEVKDDPVTNKTDIHFIIREGFKIRIKTINFIGNDLITDKQLYRVIKSRTKGWFRSGYYNEETLSEDYDRIRAYYEQQGFIDVKVDYSVEPLEKGYVAVDFNISEGKRYKIGKIYITGNEIVSDVEIYRAMEESTPGGIFSRDRLSVDLSKIRTLYFDKGYIFADVQESTSLDAKTGQVDITLDIVEGDLAYIDMVKIQGNTRTRDIVIRRELRMYPGDQFDGAQLRRSKERLNNLGYFEDVSFDIEDTDSYNRKNLVVQVKEAKTGTFSFGGGFSTVDKVVGFIEIQQKNFDFTNWPSFTGGGQNLVLRAETGSTKNNLLLSFTEPWIFDHPVSGGFDAFRTEREREQDIGYAYDELRVGGNIRFGKQFGEYYKGNISYRREDITIDNLEEGVSSELLAEEGDNTVSAIGLSLTRDTRDNVFSPTEGLVLSGIFDIAGGGLGGTKDFYRIQGSGSYYIPLAYNSVLELSMRAGIVNEFGDSEKVPIFERFFAGGAKSIRGYNERKVGPVDSVTEDPIGGEALIVSNVEVTVPLLDFLKLATFFDVGNVWASSDDFASGNLKAGTGMGFRVKTPIGPINLDYGYPLNDEPGEESRSGKFYFSVSRGF
jgi:outer membrane protein insertion porin family